MDRGDRPNLRYGQFGGRTSVRHAPGDRLEVPDWLCPGSALRATRSLSANDPEVGSGQGSVDASMEPALLLRIETTGIPENRRKNCPCTAEDRARPRPRRS